MPSKTPVTFGRYTLEHRLARGGMGEVFSARMKGPAGFEKKVVIKRMLPHLAEAPEFVERFLDEGRLVVQLTHGNIAQVFDMGNVDGAYFLAMEYVEGTDLRRLLRHTRANEEQMPIPLVLHTIAQVAKGLEYAHTRTNDDDENLGIIHRDVSPSNVMLSRHGEVKLLDFGIAKATSRVMESISGSLHGKFLYMSPEQAAGRSLDHRSDLFSLGTCAYEALTNTRPFNGDSDLRILELVRKGEHLKPTVIRPEIPTLVESIVERCLEVDPDKRFESANHLHRKILEALVELRVVVSSSDLADFVTPYLNMADAAPAGLDAAINQELDALLTSGAQPGQTQMASDPNSPLAFDETIANGGESLKGEPAPDTATSRSRITPLAENEVPRSSRNRILLASFLLVSGIVAMYNLNPNEPDENIANANVPAPSTIENVMSAAPSLPTPSDPTPAPPLLRPEDSSTRTAHDPSNKPAETPKHLNAETPQPTGDPAPQPIAEPMFLRIENIPPDTNTSIDGQQITADATGRFQVPRGDKPISIVITAKGYAVHQQVVERQEGATVTLEPNLVSESHAILLRTDPEDAKILVGKSFVGKGKHRFTVKAGTPVRGTVVREGYANRPFTLRFDGPKTRVIRLKTTQKTTFSVRIFPTNATVKLDGKSIRRTSSLITRHVRPGKHALVIYTPDGAPSKRIPFSLEVGTTKRLGTHRLGGQSK
jgi:serine/threonine protein kinase